MYTLFRVKRFAGLFLSLDLLINNRTMIVKWIRRIAVTLLLVLALAAAGLLITGNGHVLNGIGKTYLLGKTNPDIDDLAFFDTRKMEADHGEPWPVSAETGGRAIDPELIEAMDSMETTAFLVFVHDTLRYERYSMGYTDTTHSNSFSMAKSFLSVAIGIAVREGYIRSLDQPVSDFLPEFADGLNSHLTIRHLLQMSSGIPFGESYANPLGYMAKAYYGKDLLHETLKYRVTKEPGTVWVYEGGNTVLLGMILKKATGKEVSQYFFEKVWSCIGAEHPAYWNLDREQGMEKTFSGFYATARDFARIGTLYKNKGIWAGRDTIVDPEYVALSLSPNLIPDEQGEACYWYGLHWWLGEFEGEPLFSCRGMRGQYIIVLPQSDMVIVRLGHRQSSERVNHMPGDLSLYLKAARQIAE